MPIQQDPLKAQFPDKPAAWRTLDVALIQHLVVEKICQPKLNAGQPVKWAFPHTIKEVQDIGSGRETSARRLRGGLRSRPARRHRPPYAAPSRKRRQPRPTSSAPQKSTFFYLKAGDRPVRESSGNEDVLQPTSGGHK